MLWLFIIAQCRFEYKQFLSFFVIFYDTFFQNEIGLI